MSEKPSRYQADERIFTLSDVSDLFKRQKKKLIKAALIGSLLFAFLSIIKAPKYKAEATFKESAERSDGGGSLRDLLSGGGFGGAEPQAIVLMKSYQVLKPLVHQMGLQASVSNQRWLIAKVLSRTRDNLKIEMGKLIDDLDGFIFKNVFYDGENSLSFFLRFSDASQFVLYSEDKKTKIAEGTLGSEVRLENLSFTVEKPPHQLKINAFYPLTISPWEGIAKGLKSDLKIAPQKASKSIYDLTFAHRDRHFAAKVLNQLMREYQNYLKRDHDQLADEQFVYLEKKQQQLYAKLDDIFQAYAAHMGSNLEKSGYFGVDDQARGLLVPHQQMFSELCAIETDLALLSETEKTGGILSFTKNEALSGASLWHVIHELKQQRDLIEVSGRGKEKGLSFDEKVAFRSKELQELRQERALLERFLASVDSREALFPGELASLSILNHSPTEFFSSHLTSWIERVQKSGESKAKEDLVLYIENCMRLLSVRENMLQERLLHGGEETELDGIDLHTARALFAEYNAKLDAAKAQIKLYTDLKNEIPRPDFELSSLSSLLKDPLSQKLIVSAGEAALHIKNEKYRSSKEEERGKEEISLHKSVLASHLDQLLRVEEIHASVIRDKMEALQRTSLDCINQQISAYYEQAKDSLIDRREALLQKKAVLQMKMQDIQTIASDLPERWKLERWLEVRTRMNSKIMEMFTELVESKTISHHLHHVESKPLDLAIVPKVPNPTQIRWMAFMGAFAAVFGTFFFSLIRTVFKGFPSSFEKLQAMGLPILGKISSFCDGPLAEAPTGPDLDLLRKLSLFLKNKGAGKVVSLISGSGPNYSYALGEHLSLMSYKSIVLRCDFSVKCKSGEIPGLYQVWKREASELPIRKGKGFDWIPSGGFTPYGTELIQSHEFIELIGSLKKTYDWIFLYVKAPLDSAESLAPLRLSDKAIVTVSGEPTEQLTLFADWAYSENRCRLTFLAAEME
ncbi:MAG: hypothetical protein A3E80_05170 [Chlamydiae bacterium RIFCSPHIGHO2_12_FULL_49_9]|nr:MAG: hypothetical protein A3E80_05170 [Chlamydiae bacterium RIFCSPHIGHO2_12_FULL_49_9]